MVDKTKTTHICIFYVQQIKDILVGKVKISPCECKYIARVIEAFMRINEYRLGWILG